MSWTKAQRDFVRGCCQIVEHGNATVGECITAARELPKAFAEVERLQNELSRLREWLIDAGVWGEHRDDESPVDVATGVIATLIAERCQAANTRELLHKYGRHVERGGQYPECAIAAHARRIANGELDIDAADDDVKCTCGLAELLATE